MTNILIYLLFAAAGIALIMSVIFMMKDGGKGDRNVKALTYRIGICIVLFIVIVIGLATGKIQPSNSLNTTKQAQAE